MLSPEKPQYSMGPGTAAIFAALREKTFDWEPGYVIDVPFSFAAFPHTEDDEKKIMRMVNDYGGLPGHIDWYPFGDPPHNIHAELTFRHRKLDRKAISYNQAEGI